MSGYKYENAVPIKPALATVWEVRLPSGKVLLEMWSRDATIEDVHHSTKVRYKTFTLYRIDVGEFEVVVASQAYLSDGRGVDQDWNIVL